MTPAARIAGGQGQGRVRKCLVPLQVELGTVSAAILHQRAVPCLTLASVEEGPEPAGWLLGGGLTEPDGPTLGPDGGQAVQAVLAAGDGHSVPSRFLGGHGVGQLCPWRTLVHLLLAEPLPFGLHFFQLQLLDHFMSENRTPGM